MKILLGLLLINAFSLGVGAAQSAASKRTPPPASHSRFSLTISAPTAQVKAGSIIYVKVRLLNTSDHEINERGLAYSHGLDTSFQYTCQNSTTGVSRKNEKGLERGLLTVGEGAKALKPGESREELAPVSEACDMSQPGQYLVQLSKGDPSGQTVKSNTIKITVTP